MTAILGISAFYHDSAAALVVDGETVAAAQEERFSRRKHDAGYPRMAQRYCLEQAGLEPSDLDLAVFYERPRRKLHRQFETYAAFAPKGFVSFRGAARAWLGGKLNPERAVRRELGHGFRGEVLLTEHHRSHAASAFFPSPFESAAVLTLDGVGEWDTTTMGIGRGHRLQTLRSLCFPHSLGLLYSAFTAYLGFRVNSGEYKLMGLAPYGEPVYRERILEHLIDLREDGSFWLDMRYFNYCTGHTMTSEEFHRLFGGPPREPESEIEPRHADLAASIQAVTEEAVLRAAGELHRLTGEKRLAMAGGVALNCVANGRLFREGLFEEVWVQPAAGDAGGALGAALWAWHEELGNPRSLCVPDAQRGSLLGPGYSDDAVAGVLVSAGLGHETFESDEALCEHVAGLIDQQQVVGWFQGRMEYGPRALGSRSILADPRSGRMQEVLNEKIKFRESFRPFAPAVLAESFGDYFETSGQPSSPYMLFTHKVSDDHLETNNTPGDEGLLSRLRQRRSSIPAVTHVDCSARVQTVGEGSNPRFRRLLEAFQKQTGCPVLINTSFNVRGEPIVCTPEDALRCFRLTEMDVLVMGRHVVTKRDQNIELTHEERLEYRSRLVPD